MAQIFYKEVDDFLRKEERYKLLENAKNVYNVEWTEITPDAKNNWLNEGMDNDFDSLLPMGTKEAKAGQDGAVFITYSNGVKTNRDSWVYNSNKSDLINNVESMISVYNLNVREYLEKKSHLNINIDDFVDPDDTKISWSGDLKMALEKGIIAKFYNANIRNSIYRPFFYEYLYFDRLLNNSVYQFPKIFPTVETEKANYVICVSGLGSNKPFQSLMVDLIPCLDMLEKTQCFPFYTYKEDGTDRKENISDWALKQYQEHYKDESITKWDIFYYIYAVLHTPAYKEKYAANLRRSLPRIPFYEDFRKYSTAGKKLAELHVNYEIQPEFYLQKIEAPERKLDWKVVKMKLSKDKQTLIYNDFLSMTGIPLEVYEYKLGNRSALEWIIDQYQIKTDKRSGIVNDPNREDEPDYIVRLIGKIVTVSLETVKIVREL
jgi:predicted helicase